MSGWSTRRIAAVTLGLLAVALPHFPVPAAAAEEKGPNQGRISLSAGVDFPTAYFFRGILQEDRDFIVQPFGDLTFRLFEGKGALNGVSLTVGTWNSLHGGPSGIEGPSNDPRIWYESDFYAKVGATVLEDLSVGLVCTAYMSPNGRFSTVQERALALSYGDAKLLGPFALNPSVLVAFEVKGQADAGRRRGVYLQLGVAPGLTLFEQSQVPVRVSVPLVLSLSDYYEFGTRKDDTFGYFSGGVTAAIPIPFIPATLGAWQLWGGVNVLVLGDNLKAANRRDAVEVIATLGITLAY